LVKKWRVDSYIIVVVAAWMFEQASFAVVGMIMLSTIFPRLMAGAPAVVLDSLPFAPSS